MQPVDETTLFGDDGTATQAAWRAAVEKALKGRPFESLVRTTDDGIALEPLYPAAENAVPVGRAGAAPWAAVQRIDLPVPADANDLALAELSTGATGLSIVLPSAPSAYGAGLRLSTRDDLDRALEGVHLDMAPIRLEAGGAGLALGWMTM